MSERVSLELEVTVFHKSDFEQNRPLTLKELGIIGKARLLVNIEDVLNKNDAFEFEDSKGKHCMAYITNIEIEGGD